VIRRIRYSLLALLFVFDSEVLLAGYRISKLDHVFARDVRKPAMTPSGGHVVFEHGVVLSPASFALFRVALQVGVFQIPERVFRSDFCSLLGRVFAADDGGFYLKRGLSSVEDGERRKLTESDSTYPTSHAAFPYEAFGAAIGDAKREPFESIIADEDLAALRDSKCLDKSLGNIGHVDAM
jgi:hypothetical protein